MNYGGYAVTLLTGHHTMLGAIVPAAFMYEFHRKIPQFAEISPIMHVQAETFGCDFETYEHYLQSGGNIVVLDHNGKPEFAIASREFCYELRVDKNGRATFCPSVLPYMFNDASPHFLDESSEQEHWVYSVAAGYMFGEKLPVMLDRDRRAIARAIDAISSATRRDQTTIHQTIQGMAFRLD